VADITFRTDRAEHNWQPLAGAGPEPPASGLPTLRFAGQEPEESDDRLTNWRNSGGRCGVRRQRREPALGAAPVVARDIERGGEDVCAGRGLSRRISSRGPRGRRPRAIEPLHIGGADFLENLEAAVARGVGLGAGKFTHEGDEVFLADGPAREPDLGAAGVEARCAFTRPSAALSSSKAPTASICG